MVCRLFSGPVGFLILGFAFGLFSLSFNLVGFVAPYWVQTTSVSSVKYIFGLWRYCAKSSNSTVCTDFENTKDLFKLIQTGGSVSLGCLIILSVMLSVQIFLLKKRYRLIIITGISLAITSGVLILLMILTLGAFEVRELISLLDVPVSEHFHFSYYLAVISMIVSCVAGILLVCDYKSAFA